MNKTIIKIFILFILTASLISLILLAINFMGFAILGSNPENHNYYNSSKLKSSPRKLLNDINENLQKTKNGYELKDKDIIPKDNWCILLNDYGDIIWSQNKPQDIPNHYSIKDIAKITRWFLNDYPVYINSEEYGLFILGIPKDSVGKYNIEYSMDWFNTLPKRILKILCVNLFLAAILASIFGAALYKKLKTLLNGIKNLRLEKQVNLKEKGIFKELYQNINETSHSIERKNKALEIRDQARLNWISAISHDIRTPLSIITGYSESLANVKELSSENRKKAEIITSQSMKIKKLIANLNLISSLEYDMQPFKKNQIHICPLIRHIVSEIINSGISDNFELELDLQDENAVILGDKTLIERAIFNIINNSIVHNPNGCKIKIIEQKKDNKLYITIKDNGIGVTNNVIYNINKNIKTMPKSAHGLGLPIVYRIISAHGGKFICENNNGFTVYIILDRL